ncbi:MAG: hypothetical protein IPK04_14775 [Bdellovibrionales bacterium]|nr:hypothetical protein [Bdellovibrionales bacterium]
MVAVGDSVAAEVESYAVHVCGDPHPFIYNNHYHFKITLKDGKFIGVKEYMDTLHLSKVDDLIQTEACKNKMNIQTGL